MFGNIRQGDREFNCGDFSNHVDKQNRRFELAFKSDLQMAKEDNLKGYQETFSNFISECKDRDLCVGPCQVDDKSGTPISLQLFPYVKHCLHACTDKIKGLFNLLEVRDEDKSVFCKKPQSIAMLLKQLISAASKNFQHNSMHGTESDDAIELEDDDESNDVNGIDKDEIVFNKIKQFAQDMKNENDDDIEDFDHYEEKASKEDLEEVKAIESKDNNSTESYASKKEEIAAKRYQEIDTRDKTMMRKTLALLECNSLNDLSELALSALSSLDNIERGSLKADKKVKSFLG